MDGTEDLPRGRASYTKAAWSAAYDLLSRADQVDPLGPDDLVLMARSAYMLGRDDEYVSALERAHRLFLDTGDIPQAVQCGFWIGHSMLFRGHTGRARGWFSRAERLLEAENQDCAERGYLLIPVWLEEMGRGDYEAGYATAAAAAEIGNRFGDADLLWLARDEQGRALLNQGRVEEGLRLIDEVLVAASAGELSPIVTGIVYCNTIAFCHDAYELRHAREWTAALTQWCERQPEMVAHNGLCLVHRAEIRQLQGAWAGALAEAQEAANHFTQGMLNQLACGKAHYRQGEIHRLRGELAAAEKAYQDASRCGCEPQPGLALLRLEQGRGADAAAAMRRAMGETSQRLARVALLPAYVEIMLAVDDVDAAQAACRELEEIAQRQGSEVLDAMAAHARGAVALAGGDVPAALVALRGAWHAWHGFPAPYEAARTRVLLASACRALGDDDTAALELDGARGVFEELGAAPDLARLPSPASPSSSGATHGLTPREVEVLRLVASGTSNRKIAAELVISEHTVARHVQNIFVKLGVSSRTAAGAFAYEHELITPPRGQK